MINENNPNMTKEELQRYVDMLHALLMSYMLHNNLSKIEGSSLENYSDLVKLKLEFFVDIKHKVLSAVLHKGDEVKVEH